MEKEIGEVVIKMIASHLREWLEEIEVYLANAPTDYQERKDGFEQKIIGLLESQIEI